MKHQESQAQAMLFQWAALAIRTYPCLKWLNSSQNGVKLTTVMAGARDKAQGMKKGFPDIFLPFPCGRQNGLFIELKAGKNKPTVAQKEWIEYLNSVGYSAHVCYGFDETRDTILEYLGAKNA